MALHTEKAKTDKLDIPPLSDEDRSKDKFFQELAAISESMIAAHGRDFAMGALVLAARFIAERKSFTKQEQEAECCGDSCHGHHNHSKT